MYHADTPTSGRRGGQERTGEEERRIGCVEALRWWYSAVQNTAWDYVASIIPSDDCKRRRMSTLVRVRIERKGGKGRGESL
jgi:hypothetical protein